MKIIFKKTPIIMFGIALILFIVGCSGEAEEVETVKSARLVKLIIIESAGESGVLNYPATIDAVQSSKLSFQVAGKLETLNVIAAQEVSQGEQIASLEKRSFRNQVNSTKAQYMAAKSDYERGVTLANKKAISLRDLEQLKSRKDVAEAAFDSAKKALSDSTLVAPYDAIVAAVSVNALESVSAGQHIVTLFGEGQMEAIVNIPSSIVATVDARTDRQVFVLLDAAPDSPIHATFRRANLEADPASQTYEVKFAFTPPEGLNILPGMNARLRIHFVGHNDNSIKAVSVPTFAIFQENGQHFVWKVTSESMTVHKAPVSLQQGIGNEMIITKGLQVGETIVGAGANYLSEGVTVRPWSKP